MSSEEPKVQAKPDEDREEEDLELNEESAEAVLGGTSSMHSSRSDMPPPLPKPHT